MDPRILGLAQQALDVGERLIKSIEKLTETLAARPAAGAPPGDRRAARAAVVPGAILSEDLQKVRDKKLILCYTDGSVNNAGPKASGSAAVLLCGDKVCAVSESTKGGTSNVGELTAVKVALQAALEIRKDRPVPIKIVSDSQYALNGTFGDNKASANVELINEIKSLIDRARIHAECTSEWVRGHHTNPANVLADHLAFLAAHGQVVDGVEFDVDILLSDIEAAKEKCVGGD